MKKTKLTKLTICVLMMSMAVAMSARTPVELKNQWSEFGL